MFTVRYLVKASLCCQFFFSNQKILNSIPYLFKRQPQTVHHAMHKKITSHLRHFYKMMIYAIKYGSDAGCNVNAIRSVCSFVDMIYEKTKRLDRYVKFKKLNVLFQVLNIKRFCATKLPELILFPLYLLSPSFFPFYYKILCLDKTFIHVIAKLLLRYISQSACARIVS